MSEPQPTTKAGRQLVAEFGVGQFGRLERHALAIEAEARADALREAAERVRGLPDYGAGSVRDVLDRAVLAILSPDTP